MALYLLPTKCTMNPVHPEDAEYFDEGQVAYVMQRTDKPRTRPTEVATSFGPFDPDALGREVEVRHDQTNAYLGTYTVVGVTDFRTGHYVGLVPDRKLNHRVFK